MSQSKLDKIIEERNEKLNDEAIDNFIRTQVLAGRFILKDGTEVFPTVLPIPEESEEGL